MDERGTGMLLAGRYRVHEAVGRGGTGTVHRATDELLLRPVAVKRLHTDTARDDATSDDTAPTTARADILHEARLAASVRHHPHVVALHDVLDLPDGAWLVMEYIPGPTLRRMLEDAGPLVRTDVAALGRQLAEALAALHAVGIVHRDVKPDNVLVGRPGGRLHAKLTDFGIAHHIDRSAVGATGRRGTPAYLAPEVAAGGAADPRSDVWSWGATVYTALEGRPPFEAPDGDLAALTARLTTEAVPPPTRDGPLGAVVMAALDPDPSARPTAADLVAVLSDLDQPGSGPDRAPGDVAFDDPTLDPFPAPVRARRRPAAALRRSRPFAASAAILVAGLVAAALVGSVDGSVPTAGAPPTGDPLPAVGAVVVADESAADPCSLFEPTSLAGFGELAIDGSDSPFTHCRAYLRPPGSLENDGGVDVFVALERAGERSRLGGTQQRAGQVLLARYPASGPHCGRRLELSDRTTVYLYANSRLPEPLPLCEVAEAMARGALGRLAAGTGIGVRVPPAATIPLANVPACGLLGGTDLARLPGMRPDGRSGFADWRCTWYGDDPSGPEEVVLQYYRRDPVRPDEGEFVELGGRTAVVQAQDGECLVQLVARTYVAADSRTGAAALQRQDLVWVLVSGAQSTEQLCGWARQLSGSVGPRLPAS